MGEQTPSGSAFCHSPCSVSPSFGRGAPNSTAALALQILLGQSIPRGCCKERSTGATCSCHKHLLQFGGLSLWPPQFHRCHQTKRCQSHDVPDVVLRAPCSGLSQRHWSLHILHLELSPVPVPQTSDFCGDPSEFKGIFSPTFNQTHPNCVWLSLPACPPPLHAAQPLNTHLQQVFLLLPVRQNRAPVVLCVKLPEVPVKVAGPGLQVLTPTGACQGPISADAAASASIWRRVCPGQMEMELFIHTEAPSCSGDVLSKF